MLGRIRELNGVETPRILRLPDEENLLPHDRTEVDLFDTNLNDIGAERKLCIVRDSLPLSHRPALFAKKLLELRKAVGPEGIVYCAGMGDLNWLAPLVYCGVDLFDSIACTKADRDSKQMEHSFEESSRSDPFEKNMERSKDEIDLIKSSIRDFSLRELAEVRSLYHTDSNVFMRSIDTEHSTMEIFSPVASRSTVKAISNYSLYRPEFERYRRRVIDSYKKPESAENLLILPCSARKPYSRSKSHRLFAKHIGNRRALHELIVTSPLAIVPRELEIFFPCANYDIHVSGHWYEEEKMMIERTLRLFLENNDYRRAIVHFRDPFFIHVLRDRNIEVIETLEGDPRDESSLKHLQESTTRLEGRKRSAIEDLQSASTFQFGLNLFRGCTTSGKYPYLKAVKGGKQLAMMNVERGGISLTLEGAKRLREKTHGFDVEISFDPSGKGSIFAPGITDAGDDIRRGDEVCIIRDDNLIGVGVAQMSGFEMGMAKRGLAVKVRHFESVA